MADTQPPFWLRFYLSPNGRNAINDELRDLNVNARAEVVALIKRKKHHACLPREDSHVRGDLYELKTTYDGVEYRVFYSLEGAKGHVLLVLVVAVKKAQRIQQVIDKADKRLGIWRANKESSG
jgi:phage-related protein